MKLIIYWLTLMAILPLFYLFWWKKEWRLILGIAIVIILALGVFSPNEIAYSITIREIKKEENNKKQLKKKLDDALKKIANQQINSQDSDKKKLEKDIFNLEKEIKEKWEEKNILEIEKKMSFYFEKKQKWYSNYEGRNNHLPLLFCGKELITKLTKEYEFNKKHNYAENIVDFNHYRNSSPQEIKEKILEIIKKEGERRKINFLFPVPLHKEFPVILFKNIDKITNQEIENLLLSLFDSQQINQWVYEEEVKVEGKSENIKQTLSLASFTFITTTSNYNPKLSQKLRTKLNCIEPVLDKYFWIIFLSAGGLEIVILLLLMRGRKKSKLLKHLKYQ